MFENNSSKSFACPLILCSNRMLDEQNYLRAYKKQLANDTVFDIFGAHKAPTHMAALTIRMLSHKFRPTSPNRNGAHSSEMALSRSKGDRKSRLNDSSAKLKTR